MNSNEHCRPRIDYPCLWQYRVITSDGSLVRRVLEDYLGDAPYSLTESRMSSGGRYVSLVLELTVHSDYHRLRLYELLSEHQAVKVIL